MGDLAKNPSFHNLHCYLVLAKHHFTSLSQVAVCNLASVALNMFVKPDHTFDFVKFHEVLKVMVRNLNKIIDINYYPLEEVSSHYNHVLKRFVHLGFMN